MTSVFEHILITKGWRSLEAKTKKKREASCWVSPDGKWYNVPYCEHQIFAYYVFRELYPEMKEAKDILASGVDFQNAGDILRNKGWILIESTWAFGIILRGYKNMTAKQYRVLYEYFGNQKLFRGWTIPLLYREKKGN